MPDMQVSVRFGRKSGHDLVGFVHAVCEVFVYLIKNKIAVLTHRVCPFTFETKVAPVILHKNPRFVITKHRFCADFLYYF